MSCRKRFALRICGRPVQGLGRLTPGQFWKRQDGATAVEFGLIALPFFALLFAILETALGFWTTQALETAVANASRRIYTGQFQQNSANAGKTPAQLAEGFRDAVCADFKAVVDCKSMIKVDVRAFDSFPDASVPSPIKNGQFDSSEFGYQAPGADKIVVVRAAMEYPVFVPLTQLSNLSNGKRLIMASAAFRTEPF